jgi:hypothetical protein
MSPRTPAAIQMNLHRSISFPIRVPGTIYRDSPCTARNHLARTGMTSGCLSEDAQQAMTRLSPLRSRYGFPPITFLFAAYSLDQSDVLHWLCAMPAIESPDCTT